MQKRSKTAKRDLSAALDVSLAKADTGGKDRLSSRAERAERYLKEESGAEAPIAPNAPRPKVKRPKRKPVIRDTFSFPEEDYALIARLRERLMAAGVAATKSEVLRLGLLTLDGLSDARLADAFAKVKKLKPGRPAE